MVESYIPVSLNGEGAVTALYSIKTVDVGRRIVSLLNEGNEINSWVEEYLPGCGWFHHDHYCGYVTHNEMIGVFGN